MGVVVFLNPVSGTVVGKLAMTSNGHLMTTSCGLSAKKSMLTMTPTIGKLQRTGRLLFNGGSIGMSSNDQKTKNDKRVKDLFTYNATLTTSMNTSSDDGVGIVKFLRGKRFFITGATGFLAKVLLEKILRTMPDVDKMFLLIKARNKDEAMNRLKQEIINNELFQCLRQIHGKSYESFMLSKLIPVVGDVCESNIGMEEDVAELVTGEVDIIINSAANTTFDERYDVALNINTRGASRLMNLAKSCKNLKLFLQVSTAYVNGRRQGRILEKAFHKGDCIAREILTSDNVLPSSLPLLDVEGEMQLALDSKEAYQGHAVVQRMKELGLERAGMHGWQDTYVFTKAMGEMLIDDQRGEIPVVVIRPSIIESTYIEPFPGWIEGNRMLDPIVLCYGKGQLKGFLGDPQAAIDVVPVDMVVNATLAAMAKHGATASRKPEMKIYHLASSVVNPVFFQDLTRFFYEYFTSSPYMDLEGRPIHVQRMKTYSSIDDFFSEIWRDTTQRIHQQVSTTSASNGKLSPRLQIARKKTVEPLKHLANLYQPYTFFGGRFDNTNTERLMEESSEEEKKSFGFDVRSIDWQNYIKTIHIPGLRKHVMKARGISGN